MRLNKYLIEITNVTDEEIDGILDKGFEWYWDYMKKKWKLWPLIFLAINTAFNDFGVAFYPKFATHLIKGIPKGVKGLAVPSGHIFVYLTRKEFKYLKNPAGIEKMKGILRGTLTHELTHVKQYKKMPEKKIESIVNTGEYFFHPMEMEAYAREIPIELKQGHSETLELYHSIKGENKKGWQKFLKKTYQYVDMENDEKLKLKLLKQMKKDTEGYNELIELMKENEV